MSQLYSEMLTSRAQQKAFMIKRNKTLGNEISLTYIGILKPLGNSATKKTF